MLSRQALIAKSDSRIYIRQFFFFLLFPLSLSLQGCVRNEIYLTDWPEPAVGSKNECTDISGIYKNIGATHHFSKTESYLYDKITNEGIFGTHECACNVTLKWTSSARDKLLVTINRDSGYTVEETLLEQAKGDYSCTDGVITVNYAEGYERGTDGFIEYGIRKFTLAEDSSLTLEEKGTFLAHLLVVIPFASESVAHTRWMRVEQEQAQSKYSSAMKSDNNRDRINLLCQSAIKGNPHAAAQLGLMYAVGLDGIRPNIIESYRWYGLAERLGQEGAAESLRLLKQRMTKRQYSDATRLSNGTNNSISCETATE